MTIGFVSYPHPCGISSSALYFHFKNLAIGTPTPLEFEMTILPVGMDIFCMVPHIAVISIFKTNNSFISSQPFIAFQKTRGFSVGFPAQ